MINNGSKNKITWIHILTIGIFVLVGFTETKTYSSGCDWGFDSNYGFFFFILAILFTAGFLFKKDYLALLVQDIKKKYPYFWEKAVLFFYIGLVIAVILSLISFFQCYSKGWIRF
ncbi:hypothetical protein HYT59_01470 [Candidatus Woesebacteria bacterium]|nr:hypothetical protein [Candidatus Woesebacteria bacterium]